MKSKKFEKKEKTTKKQTKKSISGSNVSNQNSIFSKVKKPDAKMAIKFVLKALFILYVAYILVCFTQVNMHSNKISEDYEYPVWNFLGRM